MTTPPDDAFSTVLEIYAQYPLDAGDGVLLLDSKVCLEVERLADEWDEILRRNTAHILRETARSVVVAIARPQSTLLDSDYQLWRDLHEELREADIELLPLKALPAA